MCGRILQVGLGDDDLQEEGKAYLQLFMACKQVIGTFPVSN